MAWASLAITNEVRAAIADTIGDSRVESRRYQQMTILETSALLLARLLWVRTNRGSFAYFLVWVTSLGWDSLVMHLSAARENWLGRELDRPKEPNDAEARGVKKQAMRGFAH